MIHYSVVELAGGTKWSTDLTTAEKIQNRMKKSNRLNGCLLFLPFLILLCINLNDQLLITFSGSQKLGLPKKGHILVLETDGTEIDDDKILLEMQSESLIILMEGESWIPQIPIEEQVNITSIEQKSDSEKINEIISLDSAAYMESFANRRCSTVDDRTPLPPFSDLVHRSLLAGNSRGIWHKMVDEASNYYLANYRSLSDRPLEKSCIANTHALSMKGMNRGQDGIQSLFSKCLSQKMRHMRWSLKRKNLPIDSNSAPIMAKKAQVPTIQRREERPDEEYDRHVEELRKEFDKNKPDDNHIDILLKETFGNRRLWLTTLPAGRIKPIVEVYPCFEWGQFVMGEFAMVLGST
ncbi:uncharacterized protein LOC117970366 isoform X2 [Acipenser ruthenus]|uniref:uncharacterized protein LOC117970366 isoform X2 n=1 Tax=Acipenser ruthenus TaxID=7906 RepID=UPI0027412156|nr:uncharacterized protein LOC117970366 isoform X2 [Acipenser ruthenus]